MPRNLSFLIGPELFWLLMLGGATLLAQANVPPSKAVEAFMENLAWYVPLAALLLFGLWLIPGVETNWLLLRVWIASILGAHYSLEKALSAHSEQGPGVGTVYIAGMSFLFFVLIVGTIVVLIFFRK
ncbi:hypothetical protein GCM10023189_20370 [Nibrella saemangeumensis]|uniref:Uncharacterized protein n=1 Tax=Nibrella saemangeumensis TaxID=1084526 RepID=A0ABP8MPU5_9BACT